MDDDNFALSSEQDAAAQSVLVVEYLGDETVSLRESLAFGIGSVIDDGDFMSPALFEELCRNLLPMFEQLSVYFACIRRRFQFWMRQQSV
jgi:hypothetical protein